MLLSDAEQQLLMAVYDLSQQNKTADVQTLSERGQEYFRGTKLDWSGAFDSLITRGLLTAQDGAYLLTEQGDHHAELLCEARPPIWYWYQDFYAATEHSRAHATFCERVYGKNLCQHGYTTMAQLDHLLDMLALNANHRVLDLGCGDGMIAEYISDTTQAQVMGIDYIPEAIRQAQERTVDRRARLNFSVQDMNHLYLEPHSFDVILSSDTLYFGDLEVTTGHLKNLLKPGGQMGIFFTHILWNESDDRAALQPDQTPLALALTHHGLTFQTWDLTRAEYERSQVSKQTAEDLKAEFEAENNLFLVENRLIEANGNIRFYESGAICRYLYLVRSH